MDESLRFLDFAVSWLHASLAKVTGWTDPGIAAVVGAVRRHAGALVGMEASEAEARLIAIVIAVCALMIVSGWIPSVRRGAARGARRTAPAASGDLRVLTRAPRRLGIAAAVLFASVFGGWSVFAPLASAALAPGIVSPDGHRKTIQHLEGGIIRQIHVREGDRVEAGQALITLDDTRARAGDAEIRKRLLHVLAAEARLEAERTDAARIVFPDPLLQDGSEELRQVLDGQRQLLESRRSAHHGRTEVLEARIRQLGEQNAGLAEVIAAEDRQIGLIDEEIASSQALLDKGLERKPRILALQRERARIDADRAASRAKIAENKQSMGETRLQLLTISEERQEKINSELAETRRILAELRGQLPSREDILARTVIRAPISGTVMNLRATTESGVVKPGEPLLDIVPEDGRLIIDAHVRPTDIERITPGMTARVILTAYRQRTLPLIHGTLRSVSADVLSDERTGQSYYLAKVEIAAAALQELQDIELVPGMPAEVMLMDGERSLAGYLFAPIIDSARRSLREGR